MLTAAIVLLVQLFYAMSLAEAREHKFVAQQRERQLRILVASGDDVSGQAEQPSAQQQPSRLARTGVDLTAPLSLSFVLMLDGALLLMATATRPKRALS